MEQEVLTQLVILGILVEVITNAVKHTAPNLQKRYMRLLAGTVAILIAILARVGMFAALHIYFPTPIIDYVLTGLILSRGSNFIHDISNRLGRI